MTTTDLRLGGDDLPVKFGRKGRQWLERKIRATFAGTFVRWGNEDAVALCVEWYMERPERYVRWEDSDEWRGRGFSNGCWTFNVGAVYADFEEADRATDRGLDAMYCPSLEEWLGADLDDDLLYAGDKGGVDRLPVEVREQLRIRSIQRSRRRVCKCGASFIAERSNAVRCAECVAAARAPRDERARAPRKTRT